MSSGFKPSSGSMSNFCSSWRLTYTSWAVSHGPATKPGHLRAISIALLPPVLASSPPFLSASLKLNHLLSLCPLSLKHSHENFSHPAHFFQPTVSATHLSENICTVWRCYTQQYLCKLHSQILMSLVSGSLLLTNQLRSLIIQLWRGSFYKPF